MPNVPLITGGAQKIPRKETLTTGAALAFAKASFPPSQTQQSAVQAAPKTAVQSSVSPMSKVRLIHHTAKVTTRATYMTVVYSVTKSFGTKVDNIAKYPEDERKKMKLELTQAVLIRELLYGYLSTMSSQ